jgi:hypothetical protein
MSSFDKFEDDDEEVEICKKKARMMIDVNKEK